jgi:hypothetical protein
VAVLPDTQYLFDADSGDPAPLLETFRCLIAERYVFAWFLEAVPIELVDRPLSLSRKVVVTLSDHE